MSRTRQLLPAGAAAFLLIATLAAPMAVQAAARELYSRRCSWCHGEDGRGDGPAAAGMLPRPRDFVRANYKIRSTPHGELPTDDDLFNVISHGVAGTPMPAWDMILSKQDRWDLVSFLKSLSPRFKTEKPARLLVPSGPASLERGAQLYREARCSLCHGEAGRGNGPITTTLNFEWGLPYRPRNLTRGWTFKGGHEPRDIYLRITGGLNGTPMGPYQDLLSDQDRWDLAHYVASLDEEPNETSDEFVIVATSTAGKLPAGYDSPRWAEAHRVVVPLAGQVVRDPPLRWWTPTAGSVTVRALCNGIDIAFLVEWDDPTDGTGTFADSVLLQFPLRSASKPYFLFGDADNPVRVWQWQSRRVAEEWTAVGSVDINPEPASFRAKGVWEHGRWHVVFQRSLSGAPAFEPGMFLPILFSVLDGSNGEAGDVRAVSTWLYTTIEKPAAARAWLLGLVYFVGAVTVEQWILLGLHK